MIEKDKQINNTFDESKIIREIFQTIFRIAETYMLGYNNSRKGDPKKEMGIKSSRKKNY